MWFKVDDGFYDHPKVITLREQPAWDKALALWVLAGSYCSRHMTDGHVKYSAVRSLGFLQKHAEALVAAELWESTATGYRFHDWLAVNPSRESVETRKEQNRKRVSKWKSEHNGNALPERSEVEVVTLPPTRPDPTRPEIPPTPPEGVAVRDQLEAEPEPAKYPAAFEALWEHCRRTHPTSPGNKWPAVKAWRGVGKPSLEAIRVAWDAYLLSSGPQSGACQHVATWLGARGWEDEYKPAPGARAKVPPIGPVVEPPVTMPHLPGMGR